MQQCGAIAISYFAFAVVQENPAMTTNSSGNLHNWDVSREPSLHDHSAAAQRMLSEAIERQQIGLEGLQAARIQLLKLFERIERLGGQIDEAFGGNPFLPHVPPEAPANRRRFNAYFEEHRQLTRLFGRAVELWMLTCGMSMREKTTGSPY